MKHYNKNALIKPPALIRANVRCGTSRFLQLTTITLLLTFLLACGYRLAGSGIELPPEARTLSIPTFENHTFEPTIESVVTKHIREAFLTNGRLELIPSQADADLVLKGTVVHVGLIPLSFNRDRNIVNEYRVKILTDISLEEPSSKKVLWENHSLEVTAEYLVTEDTSKTQVAKNRAIAEASRYLAESLVTQVLEGRRR